MSKNVRWFERRRLVNVIGLVLMAVLIGGVGAFALIEHRPALAAQIADQVRNLFGPRVVAQVETIVFQVQDTLKQWQYRYGDQQAESPWRSESPAPKAPPLSTTSPPTLTPSPRLATPTPTPTNQRASPTPPSLAPPSPTFTDTPTPTSTPQIWELTNLAPFGALEGEGVWQTYLFDLEGQPVAMRTFLQPDPLRPYAIVAVVAFDLTRTRLHFVLGFNDPGSRGGPKGDGLIPEEDRRANHLLAAFNGGFRSANGMFGAMANGIVALPPLDGKATLGIYDDGTVHIGRWGYEITASPHLEAWRQNCSPVIQAGEISPQVYNDSITDWGGSISNYIVTRRSGIGLDQPGKTLYYFAGPSLGMPALADAMQAAGVYDGMLLDINNFWVHFTAFHEQDGRLVAEPLLPTEMIDAVDRYLGASPVDFFYVTLRQADTP